MQGVRLVIFLGVAEQMAAATAADNFLLAVGAHLQRGVESQCLSPAIVPRGWETAASSGNRRSALLARFTDLLTTPLSSRVIYRFAVVAQDYSVDALGSFAANPAAAEVLQSGLGSAVDGIAEAPAAGYVIDQQASFRKRDTLRHAGREKRFAPFPGAHRLTRGMISFSDFVEHFQPGFNHDPVGADAGGIAAGEAEGALGDAAVGLVIDAAILGAINKIDAVAAHATAVLTEATAVAVVRAGEIEKRILHLDTLDVADARRGNVHMTAGVDAVAAGRSAHAGAVNIVEPLCHRNASGGVAAVEVSRPADEFQVAGGGSVDVIVAPRGIDHLGDAFADRGDQYIADARRRAAGRRIFAVEYRPLRHMDFHRTHFAVAPRHVPKKGVRERQRNVGHSTGQGGVMIRIGLWTRSGEIKMKLVIFLRHGAEELLRD